MSASATVPASRDALQRRLPPIVAGLSIIGPFAVDTYLPSFGAIGAELRATPLQVQQTLTAYLVPFAVMALWHGSLSDALGRRRVVLAGLALFALASIGAALASSIEALLAWRALQGTVAGIGMTVGRAVIRDVSDGPQAQRMLAQVTVMFAIAPAVAPIIGGWLDAVAGWRSVFVFLALLALAVMAFCWRFLPETLAPEQRQSVRPVPMARAYWALLRDAAFMRLATVLALNFAGFFLYVLAAPVYLTEVLRLSPQAFAWLFVPAVTGTAIGALLSARLAGRLAARPTIWIGYAIMFAAVAANLAQAALMSPPRVPWATLPVMAYTIGMSLAMSPLQVMVLDRFAQRRGLVASGMAFMQSAGNALVAGLLAPVLWHSALTMAAGALALLAAGASLFAWQSRSTRPSHP